MKILKTEAEINTAKKITTALIAAISRFERLPKGKTKEDRKWKEGFDLALKYPVIEAANMTEDPEFIDATQKAIHWAEALELAFERSGEELIRDQKRPRKSGQK